MYVRTCMIPTLAVRSPVAQNHNQTNKQMLLLKASNLGLLRPPAKDSHCIWVRGNEHTHCGAWSLLRESHMWHKPSGPTDTVSEGEETGILTEDGGESHTPSHLVPLALSEGTWMEGRSYMLLSCLGCIWGEGELVCFLVMEKREWPSCVGLKFGWPRSSD
jgi:hypothetical protein